jgi:hypothetical protein
MEMWDAKRLRSLEEENCKLKKLSAESMLEQAALKELLTKKMGGPAKRQAVAHLRNVLRMSERRACILVSAESQVDPQSIRTSKSLEFRSGNFAKLPDLLRR